MTDLCLAFSDCAHEDPMSEVFGRPCVRPTYCEAFNEWLISRDPSMHAMARNLMHDDRVSERRSDEFDRLIDRGPGFTHGQRLADALNDYFLKRVRFQSRPDFLSRALNRNNLRTHGKTGAAEFGAEMLVRVLDLSGMGPVYEWAKTKTKIRAFQTYPNGMPCEDWVNQQLRRPKAHQEEFLRKVLKAMNAHRRTRNKKGRLQVFQPTWVVRLSEFQPFIAQGPHRWLEVVGVPKETWPRWVALLAYPAVEAGTIARPTQLDAGWDCCHFPSPAALCRCGHSMDLSGSGLTILLEEFIHKQIDHSLDHWVAAGSRLEPTDQPIPKELPLQRARHHQGLQLRYGASPIATWMPEPM
jgi:hypothetical protein